MTILTTTNIVGSASKKTWSQAQTLAITDDHKIMIVMGLSCEEDTLIDLTTIGVELLSEIERKSQSAKNVKELKDILDTLIVEIKEGLEISLLVGSLQVLELFLYGKGEVAAYLSRDGKLAKLRDNWGEGTSTFGILKEGDVVVLSTNKFVEVISLSKFKEIITKDENPAELLAPIVHTQTETSGVAATIGIVQKSPKKIKWPLVKFQNESPRKINLWIGGVILILLIIMIGIGMVRRVKIVAENEFNSLNNNVKSKIAETTSVGDLNPERARSLLAEASNEIEAYLATDIRDEYKQKGKKLLDDIKVADETVFKKNDIQLNIIVELSILAEGLKSDSMKSDGKDNLIFIDTQSPRIVSMNIVDRSRQTIATKNNDKYADIGIGETMVYGLNTSGVTEYFWKKETVKKMIEPDEFWKQPTIIEMFAGNAYVFDKEQSEIWKYPTLGDSFGDRRRWLAAGITPDLSKVVDMKVVGDVWLLTSTGKLEKYSRGAPVAFPMDGFPAIDSGKKLSNPSAMWVTDSLVYVLENGASRVVVFGTDGKYKAQYTNSEFAKASDLVVVDDKVYVLTQNTVKEFGI